jgi:hypothetical protein
MHRIISSMTSIVVMGVLGGCGGSGGGTPPPPPPPPAGDTTAPTISSTSPDAGAVDVNRLGNITATFSETLNAATVDATSFSVVDGNGRDVSGSVSLDAGTNTATFTPDAPLSLISSYTVTLSTAITDTAANALASAEVWTFTASDGGWKVAEAIDVGAPSIQRPEIAIDLDGNVIAVWLRGDGAGDLDVYANRFSAAAGTWGVPELLEAGDGLALNVSLAMDPSGNVIAIWHQHDVATPEVNTWVNRYDASSESWDGAATDISDASGVSANVGIAMAPDGSAVAVWEETDVMGDLHVIVSRYSASSGVWSGSTPLDDGVGPAIDPVVVMDDAGNAIVVWEQESVFGSGVFDIKASHYSATSDSWGLALAIESDAGDSFAPKIDISAAGDAVIAWEQEAVVGSFIYDIRASVYSAAGAIWSAPAIIDNGVDDATGSRAVIDAAGNVTVAWQQDDGTGIAYDIFANRRPAASGSWGMAVQLDNLPGDSNFPRLAAGVDGDSIVVWQQIDAAGAIELFARTFLAVNDAWGPEVSLPTDPGDALVPSLVADANGNGVVVWAHNDASNVADIVASRYIAATDTWSAADTLNDENGDVFPPIITMNPNGIAAVAWAQVTAAGTVDLFGNRFD